MGRFEEVLPDDNSDYSSIQKTRVTDTLLHVRTTVADGGAVVSAMEYLHRDHLGSVEAVTDAGGASLLVQAYDPFGERRKSDWMGMLSASERQTLADNQPLQTSRGYTGHEHLDRTGFIHMNGRLYDPQLGRFLSPDPIVAAPGSSQSWNSYSYVSNSPLSYVDPGGQFQAGIGCNVGYVMCMNGGGNTSGGGGNSQSSETATIRTYQTHTVYVVDWEPSTTWNPGDGGVFRHPDDRRDVHRGGVLGDVWGGNETIQYTPFVTTFSYAYWATETRQIQNPAEEQSPASKPMGTGVGEIGGSQEGTPQQNLNEAVSEFRRLYDIGKIDAPWVKNYEGGLDNPAFSFRYVDEVRPDRVGEMDIYDFKGATVFRGGADTVRNALDTVAHEIRHLEPGNIAHLKAGRFSFRLTIAQEQANRFGRQVVRIWEQNSK